MSQSNVAAVLKQLTGYTPVTVSGSSYSLTDRFTPAAKTTFRAFWAQYFTNLGIPGVEHALTRPLLAFRHVKST